MKNQFKKTVKYVKGRIHGIMVNFLFFSGRHGDLVYGGMVYGDLAYGDTGRSAAIVLTTVLTIFNCLKIP